MKKKSFLPSKYMVPMIATIALNVLNFANIVSACSFTISGTTMTLDGDCITEETILIPDGYTLDGAGHTITAEDPASGHFLGAIVKNEGTTAYVTNLTIDTNSLNNTCDDGDDRLRGILFDGASGSITNCTIRNINQGQGSGCQEGNGIEVRNSPYDGTHPGTKKVIIADNTVEGYQKNGITANGDVNVTIKNNYVHGYEEVGFIAQNGVQLGFGAKGEVKKNEVLGNWFTGSGWTATGILIFESDDVTVQDNDALNNQTGIAVESWGWYAPSADKNRIIKNTVGEAMWGITVQSISWTGYSKSDSSADNNKVTNNSISSSGGDIGVYVGVYDIDGTYNPSAENNKVVHNTISGFDTDIDDNGISSKVHANIDMP